MGINCADKLTVNNDLRSISHAPYSPKKKVIKIHLNNFKNKIQIFLYILQQNFSKNKIFILLKIQNLSQKNKNIKN